MISLRDILKNYDYTDNGRKKNIENVITIARFLDYKNYDVVISVVAPFRNLRENLKETNNVKEFYIHTDNKRGREKYFCKNYEKPEKNYIDIDTTKDTIQESINKIIKILNI